MIDAFWLLYALLMLFVAGLFYYGVVVSAKRDYYTSTTKEDSSWEEKLRLQS